MSMLASLYARIRRLPRALKARQEQRRSQIGEILSDERVRQAIASEAQRLDRPAFELEREAHQRLESMSAHYHHNTVRWLDPLFGLLLRHLYPRIEFEGLQRLQQLSESYQLVYLPAHRSHIDYLLISWGLYQRGLPLPHIAAGENLNLPLVGRILKRGGAVFLRRSFLDDPLYTCLVRVYLEQLLLKEHSFELFIEGQRSRTGRLLPPKLGLLEMLLSHGEQQKAAPLALVPISVNYDLCLDNSQYQRELAGTPKRPESLLGLLSSITLLFRRCGGAYLKVGEPLFTAPTQARQPTPEIAQQVMQQISGATLASETARVATLVLGGADNSIQRQSLEQGIADINQLLPGLGVALPAGDQPPQQLLKSVIRRQQLSLYGQHLVASEKQSGELCYYRNNLAHALIMPGLLLLLAARLPAPNRSTLTRLMNALEPYIAAEFTLAPQALSAQQTREVLLTQGLLRAEGIYLRPRESLLALALMRLAETLLLRQYLLVRLIAQQPEIREQQLVETTCALATHIHRWYGHQAPDYADERQLKPLVDTLERQHLLNRREGRLSAARDLSPILRVGRKLLPDVLIRESDHWLSQH
ncbi:1-acyl-sn-glycerol-3-phosphate acyltransferase [Marinobacterium sp. YM272]|uniref:1-acyl-sn-glycerol-3-phosphate acyltransferase n=1 Tax=Marinobacterium sp. YM272 TaxID=3421654 RepID=UPI003D7FB985